MFRLHKKGFEEFEKLSKTSSIHAQSIEAAIVTKLDEYCAEIRNALSQHTWPITGLKNNSTGQIEALVSSLEYMAISHSFFAG